LMRKSYSFENKGFSAPGSGGGEALSRHSSL